MLVYKLPEDLSLVGTVVDGRYQVERLLAEGGMGRVYLARQLSVDRTIALKVLLRSIASNVQAVQRFQNEARAASRLTSANTVTVFDFGQEPSGLLYIAMEYVEGRSLWREIESIGPFPVDRAVGITCQILESLSEAHAKGIIHRDIKPDNVLLTATATGDELAKVTDFGIAKVVSGEEHTNLTTAGMVVGTPRYLSPEQIRGQTPDARSDLYSLGVVLYEMLAGVPPFEDETPMNLLVKHLSEQPILLHRASPRVPGAISAVVHRALAKDRESRPESAKAFRDALVQALGHAPRVGAPAYETKLAVAETGLHDAPSEPERSGARGTTSPYDEGLSQTRAVDPSPILVDRPTPTNAAPTPTLAVPPSRRRAVLLGVLLTAVVGAFAFAVSQLGDGGPAGAKLAAGQPPRAPARAGALPQDTAAVRPTAEISAQGGAAVTDAGATAAGSADAGAAATGDAAPQGGITAGDTGIAAATEDAAAEAGGAGEGADASALEAANPQLASANGGGGSAPAARVIHVASTPDGAEVLVDGEVMGTTPWDAAVPPSGSLVVTLRRRGYDDTEQTLDGTTPDELTVTMLKRQRSKPPKEPKASAGSQDKPPEPAIDIPYID